MDCPSCGAEMTYAGKSYEFSDADGNRGIWVEWWGCPECGEEVYSY